MKEYGNLIPPEASGFRFPEHELVDEDLGLSKEPDQEEEEESTPVKEPEEETQVPIEEPPKEEETRQSIMSRFRRQIGAIALAGMTTLGVPDTAEARSHPEKTKYTEVQKKKSPESLKSYYDNSPEFFRVLPKGEFPAKEKASRTK